jgi:integrase
MFFGMLVKGEEISKNPFEGLTMSPVVDTDRNQYIDEETIYRVMDVLPDAEWRLLVALWRFAGLRGSSEPLLLRWQDILWDQNKIIVHAKKTKRYEGKATRIIPIFPELVKPLQDAFELAEEGAVYVIEKHVPVSLRKVDRSKLDKIKANLGTIFAKFVRKAGITPWSKIINNVRASMETDLLSGKYGTLAIATVADWLGHSPKVMLTHYKRVHNHTIWEHFFRGVLRRCYGVVDVSGCAHVTEGNGKENRVTVHGF